MHKLEKGAMKLAIIEQNIREVAEHLQESFEEKRKENVCPSNVLSGIKNFRKLLKNKRIRKIANPEITKKAQLFYKQFAEDWLLVCTLLEGDFQAIATQDTALAKKIPNRKVISCQQILKDQ
jgi:hypothetical protein